MSENLLEAIRNIVRSRAPTQPAIRTPMNPYPYMNPMNPYPYMNPNPYVNPYMNPYTNPFMQPPPTQEPDTIDIILYENANNNNFGDPVPVRPTLSVLRTKTSVSINNTQGTTCTICQEPINNNDIVRKITSCQHTFHIGCIDRWFEEHINCPVCRLDIREATPQRSYMQNLVNSLLRTETPRPPQPIASSNNGNQLINMINQHINRTNDKKEENDESDV